MAPAAVPLARQALPSLLDARAERDPGRPLVRTEEGDLSAAELADRLARAAGRLLEAGLRPGDRAGVMCANRLATLELLMGCLWAGVLAVPINTALRGEALRHVIADSGLRVLAVDADLVPALPPPASTPALERVWAVGEGDAGASEPLPGAGAAVPAHPSMGADLAAILYTSGTTGPAKGVLCTHAQIYWYGVNTVRHLQVDEHDVLYTALPLFHVNAFNTFFQALVTGATFALGPRFSASRFWQRARDAGATATYLLGAMVPILLKQPPGPGDRDHAVRRALGPAVPGELHATFRERYGVELHDAYGSTETNYALARPPGQGEPGVMGLPFAGVSAAVVDEHDQPLEAGVPGELVLRPGEPFSFAAGYHGQPEATVRAWRNLWFHTGDRVVRGEDGMYRFVDRLKDAIRRRGENISSFEVEQALLAHPDVEQVAAFPVRSELAEDEVMVAVVPRAGAPLEPAALIEHCVGRLAAFALPRYVVIERTLPLTANGKVSKVSLAERGVTPQTWDREREAGGRWAPTR
jgi:crotonobetaine/carnitine-CoA ligase